MTLDEEREVVKVVWDAVLNWEFNFHSGDSIPEARGELMRATATYLAVTLGAS